jgi:hypothetical protein
MPPRAAGAGAGSDGAIGGAGTDGAIGAGAGFGARFLVFALLAGFAFFIPFFLRAGAPRFAFLDFFATSISRIGLTKVRQHGITAVAAYHKLCTAVRTRSRTPQPISDQQSPIECNRGCSHRAAQFRWSTEG